MNYSHSQRRDRAGALTLTILIHILFFAVLLLQKAMPIPVKMESRLKGFMLMPESQDKGAAKKAETKAPTQKAAKGTSNQAQASQSPPPTATTKPEVETPSDNKLPFILMTGADFAASDIANIKTSKGAANAGADSRATAGPGGGPGGATLYSADWYRRPTSTELRTYIPTRAPKSGWGTIACRTVERYHVEDCYILGESPLGSGFGRAVLNAAWQFLVMPPRLNGRAMVGTWVSIRITYTETGGFQPSD